MVNTDYINAWVIQMCICSIVIVIAENILPDGHVKKSVCFVLGLIALSCFLTPVKELAENGLDLQIDTPEISENTDWLNRETESTFRANVTFLIEDCLSDIGVTAKDIELFTDIDGDNRISITKADITLSEADRDKISDVSDALYSNLGIDADVVVR